jgi:molybdopterin-guanine dinucleotide biosynthesis protein A
MPMSEHHPDIDCCAIILAGGLNTRMKGRNKAFLKIDGRTILDRLLASLQSAFSEILLVTRQPDQYTGYFLRLVEDIHEERSSLTGIHAGLVHAKAAFGFTVPCDIPFLQPDLIRLLLDELEPTLDIVVPFYDGHYQPLCAIYSKRCIPLIEKQLASSDYKISHLFERVHVKTVPVEKLMTADPELLSFLNVNTPASYDMCRHLAAGRLSRKE